MAIYNSYTGTIQKIDAVRNFTLKSGEQGSEQGFWLSVDNSGFKSTKHFIVRNKKVAIPQVDGVSQWTVYFDLISWPSQNGGAFDKCEVWKIDQAEAMVTNGLQTFDKKVQFEPQSSSPAPSSSDSFPF